MKRKSKVEKPAEPIKPIVKQKTMAEMIESTNESLRRAAQYNEEARVIQERTRKILEENNLALKDLIAKQKQQKEDEAQRAERTSIRRLTHPNFPEFTDRLYSYKELKQMADDYRDTHPLEVWYLEGIGLKFCEKDIEFYYSGDWSKACFCSPRLQPSSLELFVNAKC